MSAEDEIRQLEERREAAMLAADTDTLAELMHDAITYAHSTGGMDTRQVYLDGVGSGAFNYKALARDDHTIKVQGDVAMSFYHMVADVEIRGNMRHLDNRVLAVWVREGGAWKLLAVQSGAIPPPAV
jgi:ketosteroid isomerase-like protein